MNKKKIRDEIVILGSIFLISLILDLLLIFNTQMSIFEVLKLIYGFFYVLFAPGFILSILFFKKNELDIIERLGLSFALSFAIVPVFMFYTNFFLGIRINTFNLFLEVLFIILIIFVFKFFENFFKKIGIGFDSFIKNNIIGKSKLLSKIFKE